MTRISTSEDVEVAASIDTGLIEWDGLKAENHRLRCIFFFRSTLLFLTGALVWSVLCAVFSLWYPACIAGGYVVVTTFNLLYARRKGDPRSVSRFQVALTILLPFAFQMTMGGMEASGNVMIWSFLAAASALTFERGSSAIWWLILDVVLGIAFMVFDPTWSDPGLMGRELPTRLFLSINLMSVCFAILFLARLFVHQQAGLRKRLDEAHHRLKHSYAEVQRRKEDLHKSMRYARNIQRCILPDLANHTNVIADHFVYFQPKEEVGGDHFWSADVDGRLILAVADCTGHGTPGGLLTMMSNDLLDEIVVDHRTHNPRAIVEEMHLGLRKRLERAGEATSDGVEIAVVRIDPSVREIEYAGTGIDMVLLDNGNANVVRSDKPHFAFDERHTTPQVNMHTVRYNANARLYFTTDGVLHQKRGDSNRKFQMNGLRVALEETRQLPMGGQKEALSAAINEWKGSAAQLDDMLALGVELV